MQPQLQRQLQLQLHYNYNYTTTTTTLRYTRLQLQLQLQLPLHCNYNYHYNYNYNYNALRYATLHPAVVGEVTTATTPKITTTPASQQLTSPIVTYLWNFHHRLVRYYW